MVNWEKISSIKIYLAYHRNKNMDVRIARFIYTFLVLKGSWRDGREKAPAAFCRKIALEKDKGTINM